MWLSDPYNVTSSTKHQKQIKLSKVFVMQDLSSEVRKGKQWPSERKGSGGSDGSSSSRCSSCGGVPDSSSNSVGDSSVAKN